MFTIINLTLEIVLMMVNAENINFKNDVIVVMKGCEVNEKVTDTSIFLLSNDARYKKFISAQRSNRVFSLDTYNTEAVKWPDENVDIDLNMSTTTDSFSDPPCNLYKSNYVSIRRYNSKLESSLLITSEKNQL